MIDCVLTDSDHQRVIPRASGQESKRYRGLRIGRKKRVARHLLPHKSRVGLVFVKRSDDVIAIWPRVLTRIIMIISVGIGVVDRVQPMPRPSLTISRRS